MKGEKMLKGRKVERSKGLCHCEECQRHDAAIQKHFSLFTILLFTFCILHCALCASAVELQGGVKYSVDSAREYIQQGFPDGVNIAENYYKLRAKGVKASVTSYNKAGDVIGITVQYVNEPTMAYIYDEDKKLIFVDKYDKPTDVYPHRGYRYTAEGKLFLTSLTVSPNETFRFEPEGRLVAHSVDGVTYDENGNVIGLWK